MARRPTTRARRSRSTRRVAASAARTDSPAAQASQVVLRIATGSPLPIRPVDLYPVSRRWRYVMNNRRRATDDVLTELREESARQLLALGVNQAGLQRLADADTIEVVIPYDPKQDNWAARIVPWEQLLSLATWPHRDRPLTVVRHLEIAARGESFEAPPSRLLLVNSSPGPLKPRYGEEFESECRFVRHLLTRSLPGADVRDAIDPSSSELQAVIGTHKSQIIHLACVDTYAGWHLIGERPGEPFDGIFLRGSGQGAVPVAAEPLGDVLTSAATVQPLLVALSTCYSSARVAAMAVARGARLAIGFSGMVDGVLAEQFFATFYSTWTETSWNTLEAFSRARADIAGNRLTQQGGAVVLWSDRSLVAPKEEPATERAVRSRSTGQRRTKPAVPIQPVATTPPATTEAGDDSPALLEVECRPLAQLNYSLLHNQRSLFDAFTVKNLGGTEARGARVSVQLHVGESSFPWQRTLDVKRSKPSDLRDEVKVPLVASILRQPREGIRTSLFVEVTWNGQEIRRDTFSVTLLSADEWRDEPNEWRWLPCFVLPRDAAVQRVLDFAQPYLRALSDDSACGFDGYQRLSATGTESDFAVVDMQVRAIWSALISDLPLGYINPPPTYAAASQRIRTPSQILADKRGTCIDLALLLAACLEYIGLYPVLFLIQGHAFTGYWRTPLAHDAWMNFRDVRGSDNAQPRPEEASVDRRGSEPWMVGQGDAFAEILRYVQDSTLVPLEGTVLTRLGSFADACETGVKNLNDPWSFDAMIDLYRARREDVTPLPLHTVAGSPS